MHAWFRDSDMGSTPTAKSILLQVQLDNNTYKCQNHYIFWIWDSTVNCCYLERNLIDIDGTCIKAIAEKIMLTSTKSTYRLNWILLVNIIRVSLLLSNTCKNVVYNNGLFELNWKTVVSNEKEFHLGI